MENLQTTDTVLVKEYIAGNEAALSKLIKKHQSKIYGFIYSKIHDRDICDDVFQDTFIKVIKTLKSNSYNEEGKFLPWVMRIAHNLVIDTYRKNAKMPMVRETDEFSIFSKMTFEEKSIENQLIADQIKIDLNKVIDKLPKEQKEVLTMRYFNDLSYKEIAEETGVSLNTALGRMRYAILNLKKLIEKHDIILIDNTI